MKGLHPVERAVDKLIELTNCDAVVWVDHTCLERIYELQLEGDMWEFPGRCKIKKGWFTYYFEFAGNHYSQGFRKSFFRFDELWKAIHWQADRKRNERIKKGTSLLLKVSCPDAELQKELEK